MLFDKLKLKNVVFVTLLFFGKIGIYLFCYKDIYFLAKQKLISQICIKIFGIICFSQKKDGYMCHVPILLRVILQS